MIFSKKSFFLILLTLLSACADPDVFGPRASDVLCLDFNSENVNQQLPCVCSEEFILSHTTKECLPTQFVSKLFVNIPNNAPIIKDTYQNATLTISSYDNNPSWSKQVPMRIRGRGNSTWEFPKKPYRIKLNNNEKLLGFPSNKDWVLLANYSDKSLIRTSLAFEMGKRLKMDWTPRYKNIELVFNGVEVGSYIFTEQIEVDEDRVNVESDDITGGYLIELDQRKDGDFLFETERDIPFTIKDPDPPSLDEQNYISNYFQTIESTLFSSDFNNPTTGYSSLIDEKSFIDWYLVNEILKNSDSANFSSIYYHKKSGEKLKMGPLWDFDIAAGNNNTTDAESPYGWWIRTESVWFSRLFEDPAFEEKVKIRWKELNSIGLGLDSIIDFIDKKAYSLGLVQERNFSKWEILDVYVWPNAVVTGSYEGEVSYLKYWITERMRWMDQQYK